MPSNRKVRLTSEAYADLSDLLQYTAETWGDEQLGTYSAQFYAALEHLAQFPFLGRARDELAKGVRSYTIDQYVIFYRVTHDEVVVRRIFHHRRDTVAKGIIL